MFDNIAFNVFIGLVFVFLLYSLLATIIQEIIARWFSLRQRMLQKAIRRMLQDEKVVEKAIDAAATKKSRTSKTAFERMIDTLGQNFVWFFVPYYKQENTLFKAFYSYPSIKYLGESSWNNKPSYLEACNFSQTMLYLLQGTQSSGDAAASAAVKASLFTTKSAWTVGGQNVPIEPETLEYLCRLYNDAQGDIVRFKANLETWFNQTMDRASGWYTRQTKLFLFVIGLVIACNFNVDSIAIYHLLAKDKDARNNMVQLAINRGSQSTPPDKNTGDDALKAASTSVQTDIQQAGNILSLKTPDNDSCRVCGILRENLKRLALAEQILLKNKDTSSAYKLNLEQQEGLAELIKVYSPSCVAKANPFQQKQTMYWGFLITALAISLGSVFWFDLLNRLIQLRGAGTKPADKAGTVAKATNNNIKPAG